MKSPTEAGQSMVGDADASPQYPSGFYLTSLRPRSKTIRQRPSRKQDYPAGLSEPAPPLMRRDALSALLILSIALAGCSTAPIVHIQYVNVPQFLPIPATLTAPVKVDLNPGITYGEALGSLREGLTSCNSQLGAIGVLAHPKPPKKP